MKYNSGIVILSKHPVVRSSSTIYKNCHGIDCLSQKGALFVEVEKNGKLFQVIGTHLQSITGKKRPQDVRDSQYVHIREKLIKPFAKKGVPLFIAGDLNTPKSETRNFKRMLNVFNAKCAQEEDICKNKKGKCEEKDLYSYDTHNNDLVYDVKNGFREVIDYILFSDHSPVKVVSTSIKKYRARWSKNKKDLADHFAVEATVVIP